MIQKLKRNLLNYDPSTQSLTNLHVDWFLLCKIFKIFDPKKSEELSFITLKSDAKFEENLTCGLENDMRNLADFYKSTGKCQNWDFHETLLSKIENV